KKNISAKIYRFESILRVVYTNEKINNRSQRDFLEKNINWKIKKFKDHLYQNKLYLPPSGIIFISCQISNSEIN
ncbi:MAG: hypothetical protein ACO20M_06600, partial [Methylophilaceae bacterium]